MGTLLDHQAQFLAMTLDLGALKLGGEFKLKSGRISPYFFNAGMHGSPCHIDMFREIRHG